MPLSLLKIFKARLWMRKRKNELYCSNLSTDNYSFVLAGTSKLKTAFRGNWRTFTTSTLKYVSELLKACLWMRNKKNELDQSVRRWESCNFASRVFQKLKISFSRVRKESNNSKEFTGIVEGSSLNKNLKGLIELER